MRKALPGGVVLIMLMVATTAVASQSANYALSKQTTTAASQRASSAQYAAAYVVGQPIVGVGTSANYSACYGTGCVSTATRPTRFYLPLVIRTETSQRDAFEPDDMLAQAKAITTDGSLQTRNFYPANDVDWVRFDVGPGTYLVATSVANSLYPDTVMALYASDGLTQLADNDDCTGFTRASCLTYTSSVTTTLYLKVWPYDGTSIGTDSWYGLTVVKQ